VAVGRICFYSRFSLSWSGLVGFIFLLPVDRFFVAISVWFSSANRVRRPNFSCEQRMRDGLWSPFQLSSLEFLATISFLPASPSRTLSVCHRNLAGQISFVGFSVRAGAVDF
jgi:hypothetical protein